MVSVPVKEIVMTAIIANGCDSCISENLHEQMGSYLLSGVLESTSNVSSACEGEARDVIDGKPPN